MTKLDEQLRRAILAVGVDPAEITDHPGGRGFVVSKVGSEQLATALSDPVAASQFADSICASQH